MTKYHTKQKERILEVIKKQEHEFTMKDLYDGLNQEVGLTTIYRYVDSLVDKNVVNKHLSKDNIAYYQYLEDCDKENHFYLQCDKCGDLVHIDCDCINEISSHLFKEHHFKLNRGHIIMNGICANCSKKG